MIMFNWFKYILLFSTLCIFTTILFIGYSQDVNTRTININSAANVTPVNCFNGKNIRVINTVKQTAYEALRKRKLVSMVWQSVDEIDNFYVYSAYRDHISWKLRIIGLGSLKLRSNKIIPARCYIWKTRATRNPQIVEGDFKFLPGGIPNGYGCTITSCPIKKGQRPFAVSVTVNGSYNVTNILEVSYPSQEKTNMTVCTPVLHSDFKVINQTISIIEMNKLVGAQRYIIYYYSASPEVNTMLDEYVKDGVLEIINWDLPIKNIHYYGQDVVNNDCLFRNMFISKYIIFTDLDEVIIPKKHTDLFSFMNSIETKNKNVGSFLFQNAFFCTDTEKKIDTEFPLAKEAVKYDVMPLLRVWRNKMAFTWQTRSKQIVISERVLAIRIHLIDPYMFRKPFKVHLVSPENGLLFHYKRCGDAHTIKDDRIRNYTDQLLRNVKNKHIILNSSV